MLTDLNTMLWKESRSLLRYQGRKSQLIVSLLTPLIVSVVFPITMGLGWVETYFSLFVGITIPLLVVGITVPDAIAGERERHTLETLLASRLPDKVILLGKLLISVIAGWGASILVFAFSLLVLNLTQEGGIILYQGKVFIAQLGASLAMSFLVAGLGVFFSQRAESVQIAQQNLFSAIMVPMMLLGLLPMVLMPILRERLEFIRNFLEKVNGDQVAFIVIMVMFLVDALVLWAAFKGFQRASLLVKE